MRSVTIDTHFGAPDFSATAFGAPVTAEAIAQTRQTKAGLWQRFSAALIESRRIQAEAMVARHLAHLSDDALKDIGWTGAEIAALRRRAR